MQDSIIQNARAALDEAIERAGGVSQLARELGVTSQAVSQWTMAPVGRVIQIEKATGINRSRLRPDIYPNEESRAA